MLLGNWGPHLIIVPTSVMLNWEMELKRWCPGFKILTYFGSQKERKLKRQVLSLLVLQAAHFPLLDECDVLLCLLSFAFSLSLLALPLSSVIYCRLFLSVFNSLRYLCAESCHLSIVCF